MAVNIVIKGRVVIEIMEMVYSLRKQGLTQGVDFDFTYYPDEYDGFSGVTRHKHAVFTFYTEKYATWFAIKYAE
jgi:hypothetical protein